MIRPLLGAVAALLCTSPLVAAQPSGPNVIMIIADDLGYGEPSCYGNKVVATPGIDAIASHGVRFTAGYVTCPVCSPTRAGLLSGRYQQRFGHELNPTRIPGIDDIFGLPPGVKTVPDRLKALGYSTALFGKWHLGARQGCYPWERGIDRFYGFLAGSHSYFGTGPESDPIRRGRQPVAQDGYLTDQITREACDYIREPHTSPYIAYVAYNAVHVPLGTAPGREARFAQITDPRIRQAATMLAALDDGVGSILTSLRETGQEQNSIVILVSDNGGIEPTTVAGNYPFRGTKTQVYEGGVRVPMLIQWPAALEGGGVYTKPVLSLDLSATVLKAAGENIAADPSIEGVDLLPYLSGKDASAPHDAIYWRFGTKRAIRKGDFKLIEGEGPALELYNLAADPAETTNLATRLPAKVAELNEAYTAWNRANVDPLWRRPANRPGTRAEVAPVDDAPGNGEP